MGDSERALTRDHTPDSESNRIRALGYLKGVELLKTQFTPLEFKQRPLQKDVDSLVLYREPFMTGWAYKVLTQSDLKLPLISGHGKRVSLKNKNLYFISYLKKKKKITESSYGNDRSYQRFR